METSPTSPSGPIYVAGHLRVSGTHRLISPIGQSNQSLYSKMLTQRSCPLLVYAKDVVAQSLPGSTWRPLVAEMSPAGVLALFRANGVRQHLATAAPRRQGLRGSRHSFFRSARTGPGSTVAPSSPEPTTDDRPTCGYDSDSGDWGYLCCALAVGCSSAPRLRTSPSS